MPSILTELIFGNWSLILLSRSLWNSHLEGLNVDRFAVPTGAFQSIAPSIVREGHLEHDCLSTFNSATLSIDALNELLNASVIIESEDCLLEAIIGLGSEHTNLLR
jgi:hypothetical protein